MNKEKFDALLQSMRVDNWELRLKQLFGMSPETNYSYFTVFWADVKDVFRPAFYPEINSTIMNTTFSNSLEEDTSENAMWFKNWFDETRGRAYGKDGFPWTRLGYTYDWGNPEKKYGLSEFKDKFPHQQKNKDLDEYNKWVSREMFLDPYKVPESIKDYIEEWVKLTHQFVYVDYITPDSIVKLNNHKRNTVLLVDTDSNIINSDIFAEFILDEIFPGSTFNRSRLYNEMILINVLAATIANCVKSMLDLYGRCHNMDDASRAELTMKNEFMFRRFFIMKTKKRYAASIVLREGNMMLPFKLEIKGMDFIKAGVTDEVTTKFTNMLKKYILYVDTPDLHGMMKEIKMFEREIYHDLMNGGTKYLKSQQYKPEEGYSKIKDNKGNVVGTKAWSLPVFRGSEVWNILNPDKPINSLDRVSIVKLTVTKIEDVAKIRDKFPNEYNNIMSKIYGSNNPNIIKAGLKVICIPNSLHEIPEWIIPLIDYDVIISDVISSFRSVLDALNLEAMEFKTPNGKANLVSCLVSL